MKHDIVSDVMFALDNAERIGKKKCKVPASKLIRNILEIIQKTGYIGEVKFADNGKSGEFLITMAGRINKSRSIRPRFSVKKDDYEKWEERYLPSEGFGILIVSTPKGVMSQRDAMKQGLGGKLLCYVY